MSIRTAWREWKRRQALKIECLLLGHEWVAQEEDARFIYSIPGPMKCARCGKFVSNVYRLARPAPPPIPPKKP